MRTRISVAALLAAAAILAAGCADSGPKLYPVRGKVVVDGKPASDAIVFLHRQGRADPGEPVPYGKADADGAFEVTTTKAGDGALPGEYVLTVVWPDMSKAPDGNGERPDLLYGAFAAAAKSSIKATVGEKDNQLPDITLKAPPPTRTPPKKPGEVRSDK